MLIPEAMLARLGDLARGVVRSGDPEPGDRLLERVSGLPDAAELRDGLVLIGVVALLERVARESGVGVRARP